MTRWTESDLAALRTRSRPVSASKYGNRRQYWQGQYFDSAHELEQYRALELQRIAGAIRSVVRQVSLPLAGAKRRIRVDFLVIENDGRHRWMDAKGFDEAKGRLKRDLLREQYGIEVELC